MGSSMYLAVQKRKRVLAAGATGVGSGHGTSGAGADSKFYFTSAPVGLQAVGDGWSKVALLWPDNSIDVVDLVSGACDASYAGSAKAQSGKGGGGSGAGAEPVGAKVSAFAFAHMGGNGGGGDEAEGVVEGGAVPGNARIDGESMGQGKGGGEALHLVSGYDNGMLKVWSKWSEATPHELRTVKVADGVAVTGLHFVAKGGLLLVLSAGLGQGTKPLLKVWKMDVLDMGPMSSNVLLPGAATSAQFSIEAASTDVLAVGYDSGVLQVWAVDTDDLSCVLVDHLDAHASAIIGIRPAPDGSRLLTMSQAHEVLEWDSLRGVSLRTLAFNFQVDHVDYGAEYAVIVSSGGDLRRIPPATLAPLDDALKNMETAGHVGPEGQSEGQGEDGREQLDEQQRAALEAQEKTDRLFELSTRYGMEFWQSVAAKTFAQGYYGTTAFLGEEYQVEGVRDTSFVPSVDPRGLPLRPLYLFSRHNGSLKMKLTNPFATAKLVTAGDGRWQANRAYKVAGGSDKVAADIQAHAATVAEGQEQEAPGHSRRESVGEEAVRGEVAGGKAGGPDRLGWKIKAVGDGPAFKTPAQSDAALLTKSLRRRGGGLAEEGGEEGGDEEEEVEEEDPMRHNARQIYQAKREPTWHKAKHRIPEYVVEGNMGVTPVAHHVPVDPDDEWASIPQPRAPGPAVKARNEASVQPWVMPELKKALSKQGLRAQGISTQPEEWDPPEVVEMLTALSLNESRRPASSRGRILPVPEEADEKYRFGSSALLDELLAADADHGRSASVPLVARPFWPAAEAPRQVAGVSIALDATARVSRAAGARGLAGEHTAASSLALGVHLPASMSRLSEIPEATQAPDLAPAGYMGLLDHGPDGQHAFGVPQSVSQVLDHTFDTRPPTQVSFAASRAVSPADALRASAVTGGSQGSPPRTRLYGSAAAPEGPPGGERSGTAMSGQVEALYPTKQPRCSPLPDLDQPYLEPATREGTSGNPCFLETEREGSAWERAKTADSMGALLRAAAAPGVEGAGRGAGAGLGEAEAVTLILQGLRMQLASVAQKARLQPVASGRVRDECGAPVDDDSLFVARRTLLPFFGAVRNLEACDAQDTAGETTSFFAEANLSTSAAVAGIWERVILKEAPAHDHGLAQAMVDAMKPLFGINSMDVRRVMLSGCVRRKDPSHRPWVFADGSRNVHVVQTAAQGGTCFLVFRDYAHGRASTSLRQLEGSVKKGKLKPGGGALYTSEPLLTDALVASAFRLMLESPKAFDLASLVLLPNGCLLPINETQALNRKYPARGDLQSLSSGPALKAALATALPAVEARIEAWWEMVSLGRVWDILALFGYGPAHLKRLVRNMRLLLPTLRTLLMPGPVLPGVAALPAPPPPLPTMAAGGGGGGRIVARDEAAGAGDRLAMTDRSVAQRGWTGSTVRPSSSRLHSATDPPLSAAMAGETRRESRGEEKQALLPEREFGTHSTDTRSLGRVAATTMGPEELAGFSEVLANSLEMVQERERSGGSRGRPPSTPAPSVHVTFALGTALASRESAAAQGRMSSSGRGMAVETTKPASMVSKKRAAVLQAEAVSAKVPGSPAATPWEASTSPESHLPMSRSPL